MRRREFILGLLLALLAGCGEDTVMPREDIGNPPDRDLRITDLVLTSTVSTDTIVLGETMQVYLVASNPYGKPLDVTFSTTCQVDFWVYDHEGRCVHPFHECRPMETPFQMDSLEVRGFDMRWTPGSSVAPGQHTVAAGFYGAMGDSSYRAIPINIYVLPKGDSITGERKGPF